MTMTKVGPQLFTITQFCQSILRKKWKIIKIFAIRCQILTVGLKYTNFDFV